MTKVTTDFSSFKHGLIVVQKKVEAATEEGMKDAVIKFMDDSLNVPPTVPFDKGDLAGSHSVFVNGKCVKTSGSFAKQVLARISTKLEGALLVSRPYAASLHEGISRWGTPYKKWTRLGSGKKWVQTKLIRYADKYYGMIAGRIRRL